MNGEEILRLVDALHLDKSIDRELIFEGIEAALTSAARRHYGKETTFPVRIDRLTGAIMDHEEFGAINPKNLGRISAQTAKQVIIQKIREADRNVVFEEYTRRKGTIVSGTVLRFEGPHMAVNLGRAEAILPKTEQMPGETYRVGDRVRALLLDVKKKGQRVRIVMSRASPDFVRRLFEMEVPEIAEHTVEIKGLAREPGHRTKVAVDSLNSRVDAVGACVGVRGSRIRNIVDELNGEKVDIIRWDDTPELMIKNSLKPAEINCIELDYDIKKATVFVDQDQLSLAIGRGGQNVRLASRLTSWEIDMKGPEDSAGTAGATGDRLGAAVARLAAAQASGSPGSNQLDSLLGPLPEQPDDPEEEWPEDPEDTEHRETGDVEEQGPEPEASNEEETFDEEPGEPSGEEWEDPPETSDEGEPFEEGADADAGEDEIPPDLVEPTEPREDESNEADGPPERGDATRPEEGV